LVPVAIREYGVKLIATARLAAGHSGELGLR